jgi:prepilin-type N-terminal cleavage/methylation domain-containing protein
MIEKQPSKQKLRTAQVGKIAACYRKDNQKGFTIIESLVAIVVVSILLAAIAPVIAISVATRVQARRVELASQATRAYIDGVRTQAILPPAPPPSSTKLAAYPAPTPLGSLNCAANSYCTTAGATSTTATNLYCIDFDGDGKCKHTSTRDMIVQAFRPNSDNPGTGYLLGIRVYRADAFSGNTLLARNNAGGNNEKITQLSFTAGVGQRTVPLVEMTTDISDIVPKYGDLCNRIKGSNPTSNPLDKGCSNN